MKQLLIDFPDYPAERQERELRKMERMQKTDVFISRVDGVWNAFLQKKNDIVLRGKFQEPLIDFISDVNDDLLDMGIHPKYHCVENYGINERCKQAEEAQTEINRLKAMKEFNNGRD